MDIKIWEAQIVDRALQAEDNWKLWQRTLHLFYLFLKILLMWTTFKVFVELLQQYFCFMILGFWPRDRWDLSSLTWNWACAPSTGRWSLNHRAVREVLVLHIIVIYVDLCVSHQSADSSKSEAEIPWFYVAHNTVPWLYWSVRCIVNISWMNKGKSEVKCILRL